MAVTLTRVELGARDIAGETLASSITVADAAVSAALTGGVYRVKATTACTVRIGAGLTDATGGEPWSADETAYRSIPDGAILAVDAA